MNASTYFQNAPPPVAGSLAGPARAGKLPLIVVTEKTTEVQTTVRGLTYIRAIAGRGPRADRFQTFVGPAEGGEKVATYRDPVRTFAPLEIIERLLEIRADAGYTPAIFMRTSEDLVAYFDAYGFDVYSFDDSEAEFHYGRYRAPLAPGGDHVHESVKTH